MGVIDTDLRSFRINDWLVSINGVPAEAHVGQRVEEVVPDLSAQARQALQRVLDTGELLRDLEVVGETPAEPGRKRTWLEQWHPIRDDEGRIVALSIVAEDYTDRNAMELELRGANQRKDEFLALLSNELRNPMQAITSALHNRWLRQVCCLLSLAGKPNVVRSEPISAAQHRRCSAPRPR